MYQVFRNCIKNLTIVDDTLEKLGIITDYNLHMRTIGFILGWFIIAILLICLEIAHLRSTNDITQITYVSFIRMFCIHINVISDLTITSMLWLVICINIEKYLFISINCLLIFSIFRYVGVKFDQINKYLEKLTNINKCRIKSAWEHPVLLFHQFRYTKAPKNACIIWIVM